MIALFWRHSTSNEQKKINEKKMISQARIFRRQRQIHRFFQIVVVVFVAICSAILVGIFFLTVVHPNDDSSKMGNVNMYEIKMRTK